MLLENELTEKIIGAAIEVHRVLGSGLLESTYRECLCHEFSLRGLKFVQEKAIPVNYKKIHLDCGYRADVIVENKVLLELKAVDVLHPIHEAQLMTYQKITGIRIGFLLNFHVEVMKHGITRRVI